MHDCAAKLRGQGATVSSHTADLTKMDEVRAMVAEATECHGRIDVLVNNAGMVVFGQDEDFTAFQDLSEDEWDFGIAINLKTQFNVTRCVVPGMIERGYGRIVNMSSVTGPVVANPDEAAIRAAKAGVARPHARPGADVAKHGITANAVGPGLDRHRLPGREGEDVGGLNNADRDARPSPRRSPSWCASSAATTPATSPGSWSWWTAATRIQEYKGPSDLYY